MAFLTNVLQNHLAMAASRRSRSAGEERRRRVETQPRPSLLLELLEAAVVAVCLAGSFKVRMIRAAVRRPGSAAST